MLNSGNREQDGNERGALSLQNFSYSNKHLDGFLAQEELPCLLLQIMCNTALGKSFIQYIQYISTLSKFADVTKLRGLAGTPEGWEISAWHLQAIMSMSCPAQPEAP